MKGFLFEFFSASAAIIGAVVGAGFITGAEIVAFFSGGNLLLSAALLFAFTFAFCFSLIRIGQRWGSQNMANLRVLGGFSKMTQGALYAFSFTSVCGMLAGLDAAAASVFMINPKIPTVSPVALVLSLAVCKRGIEGVKRFNFALVPVMIAVVLAACVFGWSADYVPGRGVRLFKVLIYAGMNAFLCSPVIMDCGRRLGKGGAAAVSLAVSAAVSLCVYLIMRKISTGYGTDENLPLFSSLQLGRAFGAVFLAVTVMGIATTLVSSHYPLVMALNKKPLKRSLNVYLCIGALVLSRIGFYNIVTVLYPVMGVFGVIYTVAITVLNGRSMPANNALKKADKRVHARCEKAKNKR